jgi:hypothetical protein
MRDYIKIERIPYEEPHHLQLKIEASNGRQTASIEIYVDASDLVEVANSLETFPRHASDVFLYEIGSDKVEDRWAYYFRLRAFTFSATGHTALQLCFNNNRDLPYRESAEFCIRSEAAQLNRLGQLFRAFSKLEHETLVWSQTDGCLLASGESA